MSVTEDLGVSTPPPLAPDAASARLTELGSDPKWTGAVLAGDGPQVKEMQSLVAAKSAGDQLDQIIAGTAKVEMETVTTGLSTYKSMQAASWMKDAGLPVDAIRQAFEGKGVSQAEYDAARELKAAKLGNKEWSAKFLAGDRDAVREMKLLNIILVNGVEEKRAA